MISENIKAITDMCQDIRFLLCTEMDIVCDECEKVTFRDAVTLATSTMNVDLVSEYNKTGKIDKMLVTMSINSILAFIWLKNPTIDKNKVRSEMFKIAEKYTLHPYLENFFSCPISVGDTFYMIGSWGELLKQTLKEGHSIKFLNQIREVWGTEIFTDEEEAFNHTSEDFRRQTNCNTYADYLEYKKTFKEVKL